MSKRFAVAPPEPETLPVMLSLEDTEDGIVLRASHAHGWQNLLTVHDRGYIQMATVYPDVGETFGLQVDPDKKHVRIVHPKHG